MKINSSRRPALTIYVEQFDTWWKLDPEQWRAILEEGISSGSHILPDKCKLSRRPYSLIGSEGNTIKSSGAYYVKWKYDLSVLCYSPLDWEVSDYQNAMNDLDEKLNYIKSQSISTF